MQHRGDLLAEPRQLVRREKSPRPDQRARKAVAVERLEQIIHGARLECVERVLVVRRHEHRRGQLVRLQGRQHLEAIQLRHLHVEKQQVGAIRPDTIGGLGTVAALAHDDDVRLRVEQLANPGARDRLVVDDQRADHDAFD